MKIKHIIYIVIALLVLLLATCGISKYNQWSKDRETAKSNAQTDSIVVAKAEYNKVLAENIELRAKFAESERKADSTKRVKEVEIAEIKRQKAKVVEKVVGMTNAEVNKKIDSIQATHAKELYEAYEMSDLNDSLQRKCESEVIVLKTELSACKDVLHSDTKVIDAGAKVESAESKKIETLEKKHPVRKFLGKAGTFILAGYATFTTAVIGVIKYMPPK